MTRRNDPGAPASDDLSSSPAYLSAEESRYLDGEMSAEEAGSMERRLTANPAQAARLDAWRDAVGLWRDDATRGAFDPDALVDRILSDPAARSLGAPRLTVSPYAGRWYAAAAALLMSIGIGGTLLAQPAGANAPAGTSASTLRTGPPQVAAFELGLLDKMAEGPEFAPDLVIARADARGDTAQDSTEGR